MSVLTERLGARLYLLGWAVVCRMPRSWARRLFTVIADVLWWRHGPAVQQLEANLGRVLGPGADPAAARRVARAGMRSYLRYWLEVFRLPVIPAAEIMSRMHVDEERVEAVLGQLSAGRGVIFALPHMGNYEHAGAFIIRRGAGSFTTVAERLASTVLFDRFLAFRRGLGMEVLAHARGLDGTGPFAVLARRLREGRMVCLVCDRDLSASGVEVEFFGERARMAAGPAALAVQTGAALIPITLWYEGEDWAVRIHPEIGVPQAGETREKIVRMTQQLACAFEEGIRAHPEDWHMLQRVFVADLDQARLARTLEAQAG